MMTNLLSSGSSPVASHAKEGLQVTLAFITHDTFINILTILIIIFTLPMQALANSWSNTAGNIANNLVN